MRFRVLQRFTAAVATALAVLLGGAAVASARVGRDAGPAGPATVTIGSPTGVAIPSGFLGLSFEQTALETYAGKDPAALDPVFLQLVRNLTPAQDPVLRIAGDSTDWTWYPVPGMAHPPWVRYTLTPNWLAVAHAVASSLSARLILGVNLEADSGRIAAAEADAMVSGIGASSIEALELGNEPELYGSFNWYRTAKGAGVLGRRAGWSFDEFSKQFATVAKSLPHGVPIAGPAIGSPAWSQSLGAFATANREAKLLTLHRYPLKRCETTTHDTDAELLAESSTRGLATGVVPYVKIARRARDQFRVDEMNSISCGGERGVSNTFASALWALDALFAMANAGVSGVNIHTVPGAINQLFSFEQSHGTWTGRVDPDYYGLLLFADAAPAGAELLSTSGATTGALRTWATRAADGSVRVVVINTHAAGSETVDVDAPGASGAGSVQLLTAPDLGATSGITIGGESFGPSTTTGTLTGTPSAVSVPASGGGYRVTVPADSAALLTFGGAA